MNDIITIDWNSLPTKRKLQSELSRVTMSADAKLALHRLGDVTYSIEGRVIEVGRQVLGFILELVRQFPNLTIATLAAMVITALIGTVALLGPLLSALLGPLVIAAGVGIGTLAEMREGRLGDSVDWLTRQIEMAVA